MGLYSEKSKIRLGGKTAIVTGSNSGIGKETAKDLYVRGAHVILACRNIRKAENAVEDIINSCKENINCGQLTVVELDLSSLKSVKECSAKLLQEHDRIDLLINNAGIMMCPYGKTEDGFEIQFGTNHLGHFLLSLLLLPRIIRSAPARIINVSSLAHKTEIDFDDINWEKKPYSAMNAYQRSKLANILFTKELDRRLKEAHIEGVGVYVLHPGVIATEITRYLDTLYFKGITWMFHTFAKCFIKTPLQGCQTTIYCAIDEEAGKQSGLYYADCKPAILANGAENTDAAKKLWKISWELVKLLDYDPFKI
ncbi:hypothetical protein Trydic_g22822 [Trypoxylus dichotomus]